MRRDLVSLPVCAEPCSPPLPFSLALSAKQREYHVHVDLPHQLVLRRLSFELDKPASDIVDLRGAMICLGSEREQVEGAHPSRS